MDARDLVFPGRAVLFRSTATFLVAGSRKGAIAFLDARAGSNSFTTLRHFSCGRPIRAVALNRRAGGVNDLAVFAKSEMRPNRLPIMAPVVERNASNFRHQRVDLKMRSGQTRSVWGASIARLRPVRESGRLRSNRRLQRRRTVRPASKAGDAGRHRSSPRRCQLDQTRLETSTSSTSMVSMAPGADMTVAG